MKAWTLNKIGPITSRPLSLTEKNLPVTGEDGILLRVSACAVCRTDLHIVEGELPTRRSALIPGHQIIGRVVERGAKVEEFAIGDRAGIAWLNHTCGACEFCLTQRENLCERAEFTGWTVDGGYAEYAVARGSFSYHVPERFEDAQAAPLLCAGIIGYRCLRLTTLTKTGWSGARLGLYGFGAAGHVCIQLARARGAEVYVSTREKRHQALAAELGAAWVGGATEEPPEKLDASIIFAPAGELVPSALSALQKGGTLVLGGIHMSKIPAFDYSLIYGERVIRSVANNTRQDGRDFLQEAASIPLNTHIQKFSFYDANEALIALKSDAIRGAAVLTIA